MVSRKDKNRAIQFICDRLEESELYYIGEMDFKHVVVGEKADVREEPRIIDVVIPNVTSPIGDFSRINRRNKARGIYTAGVLYKDRKTAFVRVVDRNKGWRTEKSLKRYSALQINQMLHLRNVEKVFLKAMGGYSLVYYQPESERLNESIRRFKMQDVEFDYSHVVPGHPSYGFVEDRVSLDYKLPKAGEEVTGAARMKYFKRNYNLLAIIGEKS